MSAGVAQNVTGSITLNASFSESITAGVITSQNLPASVSQNLSYQNSQGSGNPLTVDAIYAKALAFGTTNINLNLGSTTDLAGNSVCFQRIRELVVQNSNSFPVWINGLASNSSSGVTWLPATSGSSGVLLPGWGGNSNSGASSLSTASLWSAYWPTFRICDPVGTSVSTGSNAGLYVTSVSSSTVYISFYAPASTSSNSLNIMIAGCTQY